MSNSTDKHRSKVIDASSPSTEAESLKLKADRGRLESEIREPKATLSPKGPQGDQKNELERDDLELQKLRQEVEFGARNARYFPYFEFAKVVVPALSIIGSVWAATSSLNYQHNKDRSTLISEQLFHFQENITTSDINKQRNAIAAVRALREGSVNSLLANIDLNHPPEVIRALQQAILELNEASDLHTPILAELLLSIRHTALRRDIPHLDYYLDLWSKCVAQYKNADPPIYQQAITSGNRLAKELRQEIEAGDPRTSDLKTELLGKIDKLGAGG
jgi:hypothetical protein